MWVVFLGDSLTEGVDGVSYLRLLRERIQRDERLRDIELINAGVGGDTVVNLLRRVPTDVVPQRPDWVVVFVGGNDCTTALLHRSLPTLYTRRGLRYWRNEKGIRQAVTPVRFRDGMRALVDTLVTRTGARIALCTPATMGESPRARRWRWLNRYAEVTRLVAAERGCDLIDLRAAFVRAIAELPPRLPLSWMRAPLVRFVASGDWERMAALRGLRLTYDGVHMTERGAALIADTIEAWLRQAATVQAPAVNE